MSAPDPEELARKTLDLWQDQLAALAGDPEAGAAMARLFSFAALGPAAVMRAFAEAAGGSLEPNERAGGGQERGGAKAAGAEAAAAPSQPGHDRLARLERRLDELERRLAELEGSAGRARPKASGRSGKSRSGKAR
jgi:hypothetical protein